MNVDDRLPSVEEIASRAAAVRERIEAVADGRPVTIVAVTKAHPGELARRAVDAGMADLGENYAQELVAKVPLLEGSADHRWHFIGGLQRNKVKLLASTVALWHSVDRGSLASEIAKRAPGSHRCSSRSTRPVRPRRAAATPTIRRASSIGLSGLAWTSGAS